MSWNPINVTNGCFVNPFVTSCESSFLTFLTFLIQNLGHSKDVTFRDPELEDDYDFVIVGAGSAGCVIANRLSEVKQWKVLLLESGDEQPMITEIPGLLAVMESSSIDYNYSLQRDQKFCNRYPTACNSVGGRLMGGSSSINVNTYSRGSKEDYNDWARSGNTGWGWNDVLPYFKKSENIQQGIPKSDPKDHGTDGLLTVDLRKSNKYTGALITGYQELGYKEIDYNSGDQLGISRRQYTIKDGMSQSTNEAFIRPIRDKRSNLTVKPRSTVTKITIDPTTKKAIAVEYVASGTRNVKRVNVKKEVIVSAGAINSPKILLLSGIGPADDLKEYNIPIIEDLPVGKNYQDHVSSSATAFELNGTATEFGSADEKIRDVLEFLDNKQGIYKDYGSVVDVSAFHRTSHEKRANLPDVELVFFHKLIDTSKAGQFSSYSLMPYFNKIVVFSILLQPGSRGWIKLNTTDPMWSNPLIYPNINSDPNDIKVMIEGFQFIKKLGDTSALKNAGIRSINRLNTECNEYLSDDSKYLECVADKYALPFYHPVGTCKMGPKTDPTAVVDDRLRVHNVKGLRVIDASIMPKITRSDTNAATIMIAEKGSDLIKEDWLRS